MFYVKEKLNNAVAVSIELGDENVFCICPNCGCEVNVNLKELFSDENFDLYGTTVYCDECGKAIIEEVTNVGINKFNSEGYCDPTAFEALCNIEKAEKIYRPLVYICSTYSGNIAVNIENARRYSRFAVNSGFIPLTPHLLYPQFLDENNPAERELGLFFWNCPALQMF